MADEQPNRSTLVLNQFRTLLFVTAILVVVGGIAATFIRDERYALSECELARLWYEAYEEPAEGGASFEEFLGLQFRSGGIGDRTSLFSGPRYSIAMADPAGDTFKVIDFSVSLSGEINSIERLSISRNEWELHSAVSCH